MESLREEWRPVKGFEEKYEVSNLGRVKSLDRIVPRNESSLRVKGRIVRSWKTTSGYESVSLNAKGVGLKVQVHRLVMRNFVGDPGRNTVNHIDGNKLNNRLSNLEYTTPAQNTAHAIAMGLMKPHGEDGPSSRYKAEKIREAYSLVLGGSTYKQAYEQTGVSPNVVASVCYGKTWKSLNLPVIRPAIYQPAGDV